MENSCLQPKVRRYLRISGAWKGFSGAAATLRDHSSICLFRFGTVIQPQGPNIFPKYLVASPGCTQEICVPSTSYGSVSFTVNVFPLDLTYVQDVRLFYSHLVAVVLH